ncbi:MAG: hypothetical protein IPK53_18080 [bacterium]|nr:hypothetical protein [bacterium]
MTEGPIIEQMRDYAYTTGGLYVESGNGDNFAAVLSGIISMCGQQNLVLTGIAAPPVTCDSAGVTPATFDILVSVANISDEPTQLGEVTLTGGTGLGGSAIFVNGQTRPVGGIEPGDTVEVPITVTILPTGHEGCINFHAELHANEWLIGQADLCVMLPGADLMVVGTRAPQLTCTGREIEPTTFDIEVDVMNISDCGTDAGFVWLRYGTGTGPGGEGR